MMGGVKTRDVLADLIALKFCGVLYDRRCVRRETCPILNKHADSLKRYIEISQHVQRHGWATQMMTVEVSADLKSGAHSSLGL